MARTPSAIAPNPASLQIPPPPARRRMRPLQAWKAIRALLRDPDDTSQVFLIIEALSGGSFERLFQRFAGTPTGQAVLRDGRRLVERLDDREALLALPSDTLGHQYAQFMEREQLSAGGLAEASAEVDRADRESDPMRQLVGERLRDMHDVWHVAGGYGRDLLGEAALLAFTYAQTGNRGIGFIVLVALWKARGRDGRPFRALLRESYRRGRRAAWLPAADWEALLERPLSEVRRELGLGAPPTYEAVRSEGAPALA
ncbi:MAG: Coq4 family protein [Myxococcota bacterium]